MRHERLESRTQPVRDLAPLRERVARLNARYRHHGATDVLRGALGDPEANGKLVVRVWWKSWSKCHER